jgi:hypothetical protein
MDSNTRTIEHKTHGVRRVNEPTATNGHAKEPQAPTRTPAQTLTQPVTDDEYVAWAEKVVSFDDSRQDRNRELADKLQRAADVARRRAGLSTASPTETRTWQERLSPLGHLTIEPPAELLCDWLHPTAHTILFGHGDVGKGTLAIWWAIRLATEHNLRVLIVDFESQPGEWLPRAQSLGAAELLEDTIQYYEPAPRAIWDQADDIAAAAQHMHADYIIIDSIVFACMGSDASGGSTDAPARYREALKTIGLPATSLAHIPKDAREPKYPFGSIFWHNAARVTIRADYYQVDAEGTVPSRKITLTCCKYNNGQKPPKQLIEILYRDGPTGLPMHIEARRYSETQADVILGILREAKHALSTAEITKAFNEISKDDDTPTISTDSVGRVLRRGAQAGRRSSARFKATSNNTWEPA